MFCDVYSIFIYLFFILRQLAIAKMPAYSKIQKLSHIERAYSYSMSPLVLVCLVIQKLVAMNWVFFSLLLTKCIPVSLIQTYQHFKLKLYIYKFFLQSDLIPTSIILPYSLPITFQWFLFVFAIFMIKSQLAWHISFSHEILISSSHEILFLFFFLW